MCACRSRTDVQVGSKEASHALTTTRLVHCLPLFAPRAGICQMFEAHLRDLYPTRTHIQYKMADLLAFIDQLGDLSCLVLQPETLTYKPHDKEWIKAKVCTAACPCCSRVCFECAWLFFSGALKAMFSSLSFYFLLFLLLKSTLVPSPPFSFLRSPV